MSYEQRDNSGTIGVNKRKETEKHPSHSGKCVIDGKEYWISAWVKEGPTGKFFSLAFKPKEQSGRSQQERTESSPSEPSTAAADFDDDIPFN